MKHMIKDGWAFARKGDGYLAITASCGIEQIKRGPDGYRELRSVGKNNIWLVHMGRKAQDQSFEKFQKKILAMKPKWQDLSVTCINLRGEELVFGWEGPFTRQWQKTAAQRIQAYRKSLLYC